MPVDFAGRVGKCLSDWTGIRWLVALSKEQGEETLHTKNETAALAACKQAISHPLVSAVLQQFPGASITKIISKKEE